MLAFAYVFPVAVMALVNGAWAASALATVATTLYVLVIGVGNVLTTTPAYSLALVITLFGIALLIGKTSAASYSDLSLTTRLAKLHDAITNIGSVDTISALLEECVTMGLELTGAGRGAVSIWDRTGETVYLHTVGMDLSQLTNLGSAQNGSGLLGVVRDAKEPIRLNDPHSHPAASTLPPGHPEIGGFLGVPIQELGGWKGAYYLFHEPGSEVFSVDDEEICNILAAHIGSAIAINRLTSSQNNMHENLLAMLVEISDMRENALAGHSRRVSDYARAIAERIGLKGEELELVAAAGLLHDIGKIGIPDSILGKPDKLSNEERAIMMTHSALGAAIVTRAGPLDRLSPLIRHHHERWDGDGYPDGLKAEAIPLGARIIAISDTLDAITSDRPYRAARSNADALAEIERCAGSQFDPSLVEHLRAAISHTTREWATGSELSNQVEFEATLAEDYAVIRVAEWGLFTRLAKEFDLLLDLPSLAERLLTLLVSDLGVSGASLRSLEPGGDTLRVLACVGKPLIIPIGETLTQGSGLSWIAIDSSKTLAVEDISAHPNYIGRVGEESAAGVYLPLTTGAGVQGVLALYRPLPQKFTHQELAYLEAVAAPIAEMMAISRLTR
ncbi:MAG: HD domain-containing phosphohydrolase [Ferrimicrobium sp.]